MTRLAEDHLALVESGELASKMRLMKWERISNTPATICRMNSSDKMTAGRVQERLPLDSVFPLTRVRLTSAQFAVTLAEDTHSGDLREAAAALCQISQKTETAAVAAPDRSPGGASYWSTRLVDALRSLAELFSSLVRTLTESYTLRIIG